MSPFTGGTPSRRRRRLGLHRPLHRRPPRGVARPRSRTARRSTGRSSSPTCSRRRRRPPRSPSAPRSMRSRRGRHSAVAGRGEVLHRVADLIDEQRRSLATVECLDMAMLDESLRLRVLLRGARNFRAYADLAEQYEERVWSSNGTMNRVMRMPAGPTVVITPWNAPFMLRTWKCAPALAAGNTVVLKPAEWSPLSCSLLADLCHEAGMPPGVFNVVQGIGEEVGAALVADPRVRRISFTGSPETARHIGRAAASNLVPFTAELGGKGPVRRLRRRRPRRRGAKGGRPVRRLRAGLPGRHSTAGGGIRARRVPRTVPQLHRRSTCSATRRDPATTISPMIHPDAPGSRARLRRSGTRERRHRSCAAASSELAATTGCGTSRR